MAKKCSNKKKGFLEYDLDGEEMAVAFTTNNDTGWIVAVEAETRESFAAAKEIGEYLLIISVLFILFLSLILSTLTKKGGHPAGLLRGERSERHCPGGGRPVRPAENFHPG